MMKIQKLRKVDLAAIAIMAVIWTVFAYLIKSANLDFTLFIFVLGFLSTSTALIVRKTGSVILFCFIAGLIVIPVPVLTSSGLIELLIIVVAGIILELILFLTKKRALNIALATMFALASMPWVLWFMLPVYSPSLLLSVLNFSILNFIVGGISAFVAMLIWLKIRSTKTMIKYKLESQY